MHETSRDAHRCGWGALTPRRCALLIAALAITTTTTAPLFASDPVPVQQAPTDATLSAARQQLDSLKSDNISKSTGLTPGATPSIQVPQLDTSGVSGPVVTPTRSNDPRLKKAKDAKNWLVDGVMKQERADRADSRDPRRFDDNRRSGDSRLDPSASETDTNDHELSDDDTDVDQANPASLKTESRENSSKSEPKETPKDTFNPLAQYMASWLAPQDYALLRHAADTPGTPATPTEAVPTTPGLPGDANVALTLPGGDFGGADASRTPTALQSPADNPFLQFLAPPESAPSTSVVPPPQVITAPAPLPPPATHGENQPPANSLPDFVKPDTDDKYFKPLKRF